MGKILTALGAGWIPYAIGLALAAGLFAYGYHLGADQTEATWTAKYATLQSNYASSALAEGTRQANENQTAKAKEAITMATIEAQSLALQKLIKEKVDEANNDPNSGNRCLSDAARMRIDSIN